MCDGIAEYRAIRNGYTNLGASLQHLRERVDYLTVAVGRGDPRYTKPEQAKLDFDTAQFDADWAAKGRRVPDMLEIMGEL